MKIKSMTFEEWFNSLTPTEQEEYVEQYEADTAIEEYKANPPID